MPENSTSFANILITWYLKHKRALPWRKEFAPYYIWLSEIMLQQTRVDQGLPYYLKFTERFPTVFDLAMATEEEVLKLWQGLGYYSRARNLHETAKYVVEQYHGIFPNSYEELKKLKGVGDYTASAIASICFNETTAVVDGNVYRVLARVFGIATPINTTKGVKEFKELAQQLIDPKQPGTFNQAIMEFGATHCAPQRPNCTNCVLSHRCEALRTKSVDRLPVKLKKQSVRKRYFNYLVVISEEDYTLLEQRTAKGIWQNLYQFPLIETTSLVDENTLRMLPDYAAFSESFPAAELTLYNSETIIHKLSHQHLHTRFWIVRTQKPEIASVPFSELKTYPVPVLIENFISEFTLFKN